MVRKKTYRKRSLARLPWLLGPNLQIRVSLFNFVQEARISQYVYLERQTNIELTGTRVLVNDETGESLGREPGGVVLSVLHCK